MITNLIIWHLSIAKPFNPMLSETFEYVRFDKEFRYVSEQVQHSSPGLSDLSDRFFRSHTIRLYRLVMLRAQDGTTMVKLMHRINVGRSDLCKATDAELMN